MGCSTPRCSVGARAWWGAPHECANLIDELAGRFSDSPDDSRLLLAEMLMAAALGKVPEEGVAALLSYLEVMLDSALPQADAAGEHPLGFVELVDALVRNVRIGITVRRSPTAAGTALITR
jgi:hypothetical protein